MKNQTVHDLVSEAHEMLNRMTTDQFSRGGDKAVRAKLRRALIIMQGNDDVVEDPRRTAIREVLSEYGEAGPNGITQEQALDDLMELLPPLSDEEWLAIFDDNVRLGAEVKKP